MTTTISQIIPAATDKIMDEAKRERILAGIAKRPNAANYDISKNLSAVTSAEVAKVRESMTGQRAKGPQEDTQSELEAIPLNQKRVMPQKPQGSDCRRRLHEIKRGVCYRVADFAQHIGVSEDTIRRHAKSLHCLKWVEMSPDNFEEAVMNPETAKSYMR